MIIKYHDKICDATSELEKGERELDCVEDDDLEDTIKLPVDFLQDTIELSKEELERIKENTEHE